MGLFLRFYITLETVSYTSPTVFQNTVKPENMSTTFSTCIAISRFQNIFYNILFIVNVVLPLSVKTEQ